jgi:hypothetical protein
VTGPTPNWDDVKAKLVAVVDAARKVVTKDLDAVIEGDPISRPEVGELEAALEALDRATLWKALG